jgi:hypothetical protein
MGVGYDIFRNVRFGGPIWITTVATRGEVQQTLHALEWVDPGDYFTREVPSGEIVQGRVPADPE